MSINKNRLQDILSCLAVECGIKNWRFETEEHSETIETYFGVLIPLALIGVLEDKEIVQHLYVKLPTLEEAARECSAYMWDAEAYIYSTFVPKWKRFSNVKLDELIPQCLYADVTPNKQTLVLKNLKYEGFHNYKEIFLDVGHVMVSLKSLGQFHALSFIVKTNKEDIPNNVMRVYTDVYPPKLSIAILDSFRGHFQLFKGSKYEHFWKRTIDNYKTLMADKISKAKYLVYGHGDYWKGNIMFKYENDNPVQARMLDFQTCQLMSPAYDFLYFILNSTNGSLRRLHYYDFVTEYYTSLENTLSDHGIRLELLYKKEDFISDVKTVAAVCFVRMSLAFSLWLGFENNVLINSKHSWDSDQQRDKELHYFKEILTDAMEDLCSYGYISL